MKKLKFWTVNLCRLLLAATFLFSGFVKANDPIGTALKIGDYTAAMGLTHLSGLLALAASFGLALLEFSLGTALLLALNRRLTATLILTLMLLLTALTVWIYVANPVSDCGCFGDALILTNGQTLLKNLVLLLAAALLMKWYRLQPKLLGERYSWLVSMPLMAGIVAYAAYCVYALPVLDFRPFKTGTDLLQARRQTATFDVVMVYQRGIQRMQVRLDEPEPDSTWTYIETRRRQTGGQVASDVKDLYMLDPQTGSDMADPLLQASGWKLLLVAPDLETADQGCAGDVNVLCDYAAKHALTFICLTASDPQTRSRWTDYTGAEYPFYQSDERVLRTIVRANPGLVLLDRGTVVRKWSNWNLPSEEQLEEILATKQ